MFSGQISLEEGFTLGRMHQLGLDTKINLFHNDLISKAKTNMNATSFVLRLFLGEFRVIQKLHCLKEKLNRSETI